MGFSAASVANEFLHLANRDRKHITPLKMQKLVYFAHGWHLAITGKPLITEPIQAWKFGPVIPTLYQEFKEYGSDPIEFPATTYIQGVGQKVVRLQDESSDQEQIRIAREIIERVWQQYGRYTAAQLTTLTHSDDSPWARIPNKEEPGTIIPNEDIREYFLAKAG